MALFKFRSKKTQDDGQPVTQEELAPAALSQAPEPSLQAPEPGLLTRLRAKLNRGNSWLTYDLANLLPGGKIDDNVLDELETRLIAADVGIDTTEKILGSLRKRVQRKELSDLNALLAALRTAMLEILGPVAQPLVIDAAQKPFVVLVVGVNGSGKTTTIGKLARRFTSRGPQGHARRRGYLPRGRDRAAAGMGRSQWRARDSPGGRRRSRGGDFRRAAVRAGRVAQMCSWPIPRAGCIRKATSWMN